MLNATRHCSITPEPPGRSAAKACIRPQVLLTAAALLVLTLMPLTTFAQTPAQTPQDERRFETVLSQPVRYGYLVSKPAHYDADPSARHPVIVFLHGSGESGEQLAQVKTQGLTKLAERRAEFPALAPFIILSPQSPTRPWNPQALDVWLDAALKDLRADPARIYLTGLSMGGFATWDWAGLRPKRFAAIAPICAGGDLWAARNLRRLPVWAFHGAADTVVLPSTGQAMVDAARQAGAEVTWTVYPEVGHDSWTPTYANPLLYAWFLRHRR